MERLILARHAHALSNVRDVVSCTPPGDGLSEQGVREALELCEQLSHEPIELGVATTLARTQETLELALGGRHVERIVLPELSEIHFGRFEAGPLAAYRTWAWATEPDAECPGGGESRVRAALRIGDALDVLAARPEAVILAISHALPVRYVLDASDGSFPAARIAPVPHATPFSLTGAAVGRAAETLRGWADAPRFVDAAEDSDWT